LNSEIARLDGEIQAAESRLATWRKKAEESTHVIARLAGDLETFYATVVHEEGLEPGILRLTGHFMPPPTHTIT
jgi:hypothetical protein